MYKDIFREYKLESFELSKDIRYWQYFLTLSIDQYNKIFPERRQLSESGFYVYDINLETNEFCLVGDNETSFLFNTDMNVESQKFFTWVTNLALSRLYNILERALLRIIGYKFLLRKPSEGFDKQVSDKVLSCVYHWLKEKNYKIDKRNNRHVISFLKYRCVYFNIFLRTNHTFGVEGNMESFFEFLSILRNIVVHNAMHLNKEAVSRLMSIDPNLFQAFFDQKIEKGTELLKFKTPELFLSFQSKINMFLVNTIKSVAGEDDLEFLGLK